MSCCDLSHKTAIALSCGLILFVAEGINYSLMAPFFPNEAERKKDISKFVVGAIVASNDVANIVFSILLPLCAKPELNKFFFVSGAIIGATANICLGLLGDGPGGYWFASMCFLCRTLTGIGAGLIWSTGIPLLTSLAPKYAGRVSSLAESGVGLGVTIGPPLGSLLFSLGGYKYPFINSGAIELFLTMFVIFSLPAPTVQNKRTQIYDSDDEAILHDSNNSDAMSTDVSLLQPNSNKNNRNHTSSAAATSTVQAVVFFMSQPGIWAFSFVMPLFGVPFGLLDVSMSPFLKDHFEVDGNTAGLYFLSLGALYAVAAQFVGYATDKGFACYTFVWCSSLLVPVNLMFYLPSIFPFLLHKYYIVVVLAFTGLFLSGVFVPVFFILHELALSLGFPPQNKDQLQLVIGIWMNFFLAAGRILGSVLFGGIIYPHFGFEKSFLAVFGYSLVGSLISNGYLVLSGNYRRMYYDIAVLLEEEENLDRD